MAEYKTSRMTAANSLTGGLVMDFNPLNMQPDMLTNALNATIITYNGNESILQQDMGNGRVETAYLPEGYIPVGSCEFGDIIYIVSYNPLENKSQIGCFPSPERNITSDEITDMQQNLSNADFQQVYEKTTEDEEGNTNTEKVPTGVLNATSVKKIIYGNKNMNPGDKYIIYEEGSSSKLDACKKTLSDYSNTSHSHNTWPKLVKISVVSIEDSGKIVDLNASVKWYDNDYYIAHLENGPTGASADIDSYRSLVSSAYSVFQSKVSGKLALLVELEAINEFSCTYDVFTETAEEETAEEETAEEETDVSSDGVGADDNNDESDENNDGDDGGNSEDNDGPNDGSKPVAHNHTRYKIYFYTSWGSDHNDINPTGFLFTKSAWITDDGGGIMSIPIKQEGEENSYIYTQKENPEKLPIDIAYKNEIYDVNEIFPYTLLYKLERPSDDYNTYINTDSYNAKIGDIVDWMHVDNNHKAIVSEDSYNNLRPVTKVTRVISFNTGEPVNSTNDEIFNQYKESKYEYLYNLDYYSVDYLDNKLHYFAKGINGNQVELNPVVITDDVINNYFHKDIPTLVSVYDLETTTDIEATTTDDGTTDEGTTDEGTNKASIVTVAINNDLSKLVWNYTIAPVMPYGVLDWLAISGNIDFSKLGTGTIELTTWKYYNSGNSSTLTWGLDVYSEPNKGVAEVVFDFYDNQGPSASYHISDKSSYSGTFTESILFTQTNWNYKANAIDASGNSYIHAGFQDDSGTIYLTEDNKPILKSEYNEKTHGALSSKDLYLNDAGTLYPNILYLVRITVKYCTKDILGNYNTNSTTNFKTFYRWYWTNGLFNDSYYSIQDFDVLQPNLNLDFSAAFDTRGDENINKLTPKYYEYNNDTFTPVDDTIPLYQTLGAEVYAINQDMADDEKGNIKLTIEPGLAEGYNTFYLNSEELANIPTRIRLGHSYIKKSIDYPSLIHTDNDITTSFDDALQPVVDTDEYLKCSHIDGTKYGLKGWNATGYVSFGYGVYNSRLHHNLTNLLYGDNDLQYSSKVDLIGKNDVTVGDSRTHIYTSETAYKAYRDSFSLNIALSSEFSFIEEDKSFVYYDTEGNEVIGPTHYVQLDTNLNEVRSNGVPLVLAGITFSKIMAIESSKNENAKVLRSVIYSYDNGDVYYGPSVIGMHYYGDHLYFNNTLCWCMWEHRNYPTQAKAVFAPSTNDNWLDTNGTLRSSDTYKKDDEWRVAYDADKPQELIRNVFTGRIAAFLICGHNSGEALNNTYSNLSWDSIRTEFGLAASGKNYIHDAAKNIPGGSVKRLTDLPDGWFIHSFIVYDSTNNLYIPFADYFVGTANKEGCYQYSNGVSTSRRDNEDYDGYYTLADMLGSIFAQLYVVVDDDTDNYSVSNITYLENYTETWNTDIVVNIDTDELEQDTINNLITIQQQTVSRYLKCLEKNLSSDVEYGKVNKYNITFGLYGIQRTVIFQYNVPYDLKNMIYTYTNMNTSKNKIYLSTGETKSFSGNIVTNTLYEWNGESAVQFSGAYTMKYVTEFKEDDDGHLKITTSNENINISGLQSLSKSIQYEDNSIIWKDITSNFTTTDYYDIRYNGSGDDPYLKDLPLYTIFKKYYPGK